MDYFDDIEEIDDLFNESSERLERCEEEWEWEFVDSNSCENIED